ncbi:hypothetical protein EV421DRAFT_1875936 [Armillaria borealis]|uniref:Uncharacterized protein n=1 Tax=Armillaria borealis TaxID=47425 RepID=A0AA39IE79_9AGAR|nr:hypothetical protein EV421DRAFT_1875936 [Armillaria borealis]
MYELGFIRLIAAAGLQLAVCHIIDIGRLAYKYDETDRLHATCLGKAAPGSSQSVCQMVSLHPCEEQALILEYKP